MGGLDYMGRGGGHGGGQGGGHDIAAGAMIQFDSKDNFLNFVNDMVEYQINND